MYRLSIIQTKRFGQWAQQKNLTIFEDSKTNFEFEVPPVRAVLGGGLFLLPPIRLKNYATTIAELPEAIVRGGKLATIYEDTLLPTGYSHSFNWVQENDFTVGPGGGNCTGTVRSCEEISGNNSRIFVLGLTSHFGHFFVDCLDRLLMIDKVLRIEGGGNVRFVVNGLPIPQVREMIELLGIELNDDNLLIARPGQDYRIKNLNVVSLGSTKPAISLSTFQNFRQRILSRLRGAALKPTYGIYVGRKAVGKRLVLNQHEIETHLAVKGILPYYPEEHTVYETAETFGSVGVVVIVLGSSKFNLALCRAHTKVICLVPEGYAEKPGSVAVMLRQLCAAFELDLCFCACTISGENKAFDSDLMVDKKSLDLALRALQV